MGVSDGLPKTYRLKSSAPKYNDPSVPMAAEDSMAVTDPPPAPADQTVPAVAVPIAVKIPPMSPM